MNTKNSREEDSCGKLDFASKLQRRASDTRLFILRLVWSLLGCDTNLVQVTVVSEKYATSSSGQTMMEIHNIQVTFKYPTVELLQNGRTCTHGSYRHYKPPQYFRHFWI